ncbi:protein fam92a1 [Venturia nashicola]|uniref:Protein fam92a1 n=1 Tax=Venturia nashicola TaxID=86259 RepID=A0A4Z1NX44_9PEZI|nr:protein fam92a1 [Venturia nashicola]
MARKTKAQTAPTVTKSSTKRQTTPPTTTALAKRPKRQSTSRAAPTKSDYFSHDSSDSEEKDDDSAVESPAVESSDLDSLPDDEEPEVESSISEGEEDLDEKPKRSRNSASAKRNTTKPGSKIGGRGKSSTKSELWRPGVTTGLEPGTQVVIKKPKARDAGETPYSDDTIHPNTLLFLEDLAANNDRGWLKMHDPDYRTSQKDFTSFLEELTPKVVEADDTVPELPVKDIVMRIYRDIRFSKNPTPYKDHFAAAW